MLKKRSPFLPILVLLLAIVGGLLLSNNTYAWTPCDEFDSSRRNNPSINNACNNVISDYSITEHGAGWLTDDVSKGGDYYNTTIVANQSSGTINISLLYAVVSEYEGGDYPDGYRYGREVKVLSYNPGRMSPGEGDYLSNVPYLRNVPDTVNGGYFPSGNYMTGGFSHRNLILDIDEFKRNVPSNSCGNGDPSCYQTDIYVFRCYSIVESGTVDTWGGSRSIYGGAPNNSCSAMPSSVRVIIPSEPVVTPITQTFSSTSYAKAGSADWSNNNGTSTYTVPSNVASKTTNVNVQFVHNVRNDGPSYTASPNFYVYRGNDRIDSGSPPIAPYENRQVRYDTFDVSVEMGKSKTVCQNLQHSASITIFETSIDGRITDLTSELSPDLGSSWACATINFPYYYSNRITTQTFTPSSQVSVDTSAGKGVRYDSNKTAYIVSGVNSYKNVIVNFKHYIKNANVNTYYPDGANYTNSSFQRTATPKWTVRQSLDFVNTTTNIASGSTKINYDTNPMVNSNNPLPPTNTFRVDIGKQRQVCQNLNSSAKITFTDVVRSDGLTDSNKDRNTRWDSTGVLSGSTDSNRVCATIIYPRIFDTSVTSSISGPPVYTGETATIGGKVALSQNSAPTPDDTVIRIVAFTLRPEYTASSDKLKPTIVPHNNIPANLGSASPAQLESYFRNLLGSSNITAFKADYAAKTGSISGSKSISATASVPDEIVGTKLCTATLTNYKDNPGGDIDDVLKNKQVWNISGISCSPIAKKPNFQVWNNGLYTSGNISASVSKKYLNSTLFTPITSDKRIFGSWDEQAAIAKGNINGFSSGATLGYGGYNMSKPGGNTQTDPKQLSPLTISNSTVTSFGNSGVDSDATALLSRIVTRFAPDNIPNEMTISNNITLPNNENLSAKDLSQNIIFAKNKINIADNVTRIDAWLIVLDGEIDTCTDSQGKPIPLSGSTCNKQLLINGPILAKKLNLHRTAGAGSGNASIDPAEIFNLRPDTYLWGYSQAQKFSEAYVVYSRELAPRY